MFQAHIKYETRCLGQKKMDEVRSPLIKGSWYFGEKTDTQADDLRTTTTNEQMYYNDM